MNSIYKVMISATIKNAIIADDTLVVSLNDGRVISVPLTWYPRLIDATSSARNNFRLIGRGTGLHWEEIDEDLSLNGILAGIPSRPQTVT